MSGVDLDMNYYLTLTGKIFVLISGIWLVMEVLCFGASASGMSVFGFKVILFPVTTMFVCVCVYIYIYTLAYYEVLCSF